MAFSHFKSEYDVTNERLALDRFARLRTAPLKSEPDRLAPVRIVSARFAPDKLIFERSTSGNSKKYVGLLRSMLNKSTLPSLNNFTNLSCVCLIFRRSSILILSSSVSASASNKFYKMVQDLPMDRQSIHNVRLRFTVPKLWESLSLLLSASSTCSVSASSSCFAPAPACSTSLHTNTSNKDILIPSWTREGTLVRVTIHKTDTVSVTIACSLRPIAFDFIGIIRFFALLATTEERLRSLLPLPSDDNRVTIPDYKTWIITMWHFGRDALTEYTGEKFAITVEGAQHILTRIYSKEFDGKTRIRAEEQQYPNATVLHALQLD